jgi:hypothetical protein
MSIGPVEKEDTPGFTPVQRGKMVAAKVSKGFLHDPVQYIFLAGLIGMIVGLLFGRHFAWQLYAILGILAVFLIGRIKVKTLLEKEISGVTDTK